MRPQRNHRFWIQFAVCVFGVAVQLPEFARCTASIASTSTANSDRSAAIGHRFAPVPATPPLPPMTPAIASPDHHQPFPTDQHRKADDHPATNSNGGASLISIPPAERTDGVQPPPRMPTSHLPWLPNDVEGGGDKEFHLDEMRPPPLFRAAHAQFQAVRVRRAAGAASGNANDRQQLSGEYNVADRPEELNVQRPPIGEQIETSLVSAAELAISSQLPAASGRPAVTLASSLTSVLAAKRPEAVVTLSSSSSSSLALSTPPPHIANAIKVSWPTNRNTADKAGKSSSATPSAAEEHRNVQPPEPTTNRQPSTDGLLLLSNGSAEAADLTRHRDLRPLAVHRLNTGSLEAAEYESMMMASSMEPPPLVVSVVVTPDADANPDGKADAEIDTSNVEEEEVVVDEFANEQIIILSSGDEAPATDRARTGGQDGVRLLAQPSSDVPRPTLRRRSTGDGQPAESSDPKVLALRPIIRGPYDDDGADDDGTGRPAEMAVVYAEPHTEVQLNCDVDLDVVRTTWLKDGQLVQTTDRNSRPTDNRFIRELRGGLTITNAMLEDDGQWLCKAENVQGYSEDARPVKLVVLDRPKAPYLLIDSRRLDAGNIFVPVKENSELTLACISEGGNPKPSLTWEVLLSPGVERHAQKTSAETLELQSIRTEKDKDGIAVKSEAKLSAVYRAHHNARILCVMEHPTLKTRLNASILLDVQYTPSFAISRTPAFGIPLREGIEVSVKCDVDSNPPSTGMWQKDGDAAIPQSGDGYLNFTSIRRENSGWYKCTTRHLNNQYSSIGYYLSVRYDSVDVTSEPLEQEISVAASHITPNKRPQLEVQLGGSVTLQCPQGSLGCWSHLDPVTAKLRGLGIGLTPPTGQFSLKDVVYQDAGIYKCIGQSVASVTKKKVEVIHTIAVQVKGAPTVSSRNNTPVAFAGVPLHLSVEFCANPPAYAARWLHGERIYTPGHQYGSSVLAYGVSDLPTPYCKQVRLTYVHMQERVPRTFYFVVSSPSGTAEAVFNVNFTHRHKVSSNSVDDYDEELREPEEIHFPVFGNGSADRQLLPALLAGVVAWTVAIGWPTAAGAGRVALGLQAAIAIGIALAVSDL